MTTKRTLFLLFFCLSNITIHAMQHHSMDLITSNLHGNKKKRPKTPATYNCKFEEQRRTKNLKDARRRKNSLVHPK